MDPLKEKQYFNDQSNSNFFPSFFTQGNDVDEQKYQSLLDDLRAHDLIGPQDGFQDANYNFGSFDIKNSLAEKKMSSAPPGFDTVSPGIAPTQADLDWARGQQEFEQLQKEYLSSRESNMAKTDFGFGFGNTASPFGATFGLGLSSSDNANHHLGDAFPIPQQFELENVPINLRQLGLDDDEATEVKEVEMPRPPPDLPPLPNVSLAPTSSWKGWGQPEAPPRQGHVIPPPMPPPFPSNAPPHPPIPNGAPAMSQSDRPPQQQRIQFKMMSYQDIQFILTQQVKQLRSSDPFSDDYYFFNFVQKQNRLPNHGCGAPLPSWKLQHVKSHDPSDASRANKSRTWENQHEVLGRYDKSSIYKPRKLLNISSNRQETEKVIEDKSVGSLETSLDEDVLVVKDKSKIFSSTLWCRRNRIEKGLQCLLSLQDARHILDARGINIQQFHQQESDSMDPALAQLRTSTANFLKMLASLLGVKVQMQSLNETSDPKIFCNMDELESVYSMLKGKRLLSRALPMLHPLAKSAILPCILSLIFHKDTEEATDADSIEAMSKLSQSLVVSLIYQMPLLPPSVFSQCLKCCLESHDQLSLAKILHDRARAEILQSLLHKGGPICTESESESAGEEWLFWQNRFVELASAIKAESVM